ncbi:hypothetical protein [Streptomyces capparidis]
MKKAHMIIATGLAAAAAALTAPSASAAVLDASANASVYGVHVGTDTTVMNSVLFGNRTHLTAGPAHLRAHQAIR